MQQTKVCDIDSRDRDGDLPPWQIYEELFEADDVVYLEFEGVKVDITMIDGPYQRAVRLELPSGTSRQLGILPPDWKRDTKWSDPDAIQRGIEQLWRLSQKKTDEGGSEEP
ncbi:hypothetical protein [Paraburkholderia sp. JPY419]|uniref:hypothetical protein n=1 Tax=Paraburkholderia sp. JPY419 TaxID=667660 RepID=UPI003D253B38